MREVHNTGLELIQLWHSVLGGVGVVLAVVVVLRVPRGEGGRWEWGGRERVRGCDW